MKKYFLAITLLLSSAAIMPSEGGDDSRSGTPTNTNDDDGWYETGMTPCSTVPPTPDNSDDDND